MIEYTIWNVILVAVMAYSVYLFGFYKGYVYVRKKQLIAEVDELLNQPKKEDTGPNSYIHKADGVLYLFRLEDNKYLAQATTIEELTKIITEKYPKESFRISKENLDEIIKDE